jgi:hypothetical protein
MPHDFQLIIALVVPLIVIAILRINAAMLFLSVCLGYVLVELVAKDANSLISFVAPKAGSLSQTSWQLAMLLLPVILTSVIMIFSVKGRIKVMLNMLPAAATSVLLVLLVVPLCTPGLRYALQSEAVWQQLNRGQAAIVGVGAFISLLFLWTQRRGAKKSE